MKNIESNIQISCVTWFRLSYPKLLLLAIPNGGNRNAITGAILKREGCLAGTPDIFIAYPKGNYAGLWVEMKAPKGTIKPHQKEMMDKLTEAGYKCVICRSVDDFINEIENYLK